MRLLELDIHDVRGIRDLTLGPKGENCVVVGPNGSGKSAVVDAIDFLLTGEIGRLRGRGTGGFTLEKYGPHVDSSVSKAMVRALVKLPNVPSPVEITRRMSAPNVLEYDPKWKAYLEPILVVAKRGQHVLTRREILKYITAEAGTRAEEIQDLLNLSEIENIRRALVTVSSSFEKTAAVAKRTLENSRRTACHILGEKTYREERLLNLANERRALLGGHPITKLNSTELTAGLAWPGSVTQDNAVDPKSLESEIQGLLDVESSGTQEALASAERQLRERVQTIASDAVLLQALSQLHLTELGIRLLDKTGVCPLCDTPWAPGELLRHLEEKLSRAKEAQELRASIANLAGTITNAIDAATARARRVEAVARAMKREVEASKLEEWLQELQALSSSLADPIDAYPSSRFAPERVSSLLMPHGLGDGLRGLLSSAKQEFLPATPEQTAWSELTELVGSLKAVEEAAAQLSEAERDADCANRLHGNFVKARNKVLGRLYDEVSDEFVSLYRQLHYLDEGQFGAKLEPKDAGLKLDVDFYGRGKHPPHALHSEGHQDSMGLCLYLVLAERLTRGVTDLIILDDVVMSVDADHRRQLCRLLSNAFPHRQFIITTHDKNWAYELRSV